MRLYVMQLGLSDSGSPVPGYLIQTDDGKNILVDSGYPETHYRGPDATLPESDFVVTRLAEIGLKPSDIDTVVCSHLDVDHAGSHDLFPNAEFVVQSEHHEAAKTMPRFQGIREHWDHPALNYRTVDGDTELTPGVERTEPNFQTVNFRLDTVFL